MCVKGKGKHILGKVHSRYSVCVCEKGGGGVEGTLIV